MNLSSIILAIRPKTLPAAIVPVWTGCVLSESITGRIDIALAVTTLIFALSIQIATNLFNDVIDCKKGADTARRLGPIRVTASGKMSPRSVTGWAAGFLGTAAVAAMILYRSRGWPIAAIAVPSLFLTYGYTGGPFPLAYRGMGELFVILFFGLVAVVGTVFIQTGRFPMEAFLLGSQIGCLSSILISLNNLRDREEDLSTNKLTLAARWGRKAGILIIVLEIIFALALAWGWILLGRSAFSLAAIPVAAVSCRILKLIMQPGPGQRFNSCLAMAGIQLLAFGLTFQFIAMTMYR